MRELEKVEGLWQPLLIYKKVITPAKKGPFKKKDEVSVPVTLYSPMIFADKNDATHYLPFYISEMVKKGEIPENIYIIENGKKYVNQDILKPGLMELRLGEMDSLEKHESPDSVIG